MVGAIARSGAAASIGSPVQVGAKVAHPGRGQLVRRRQPGRAGGVGTAAAQIDEVPVNGGPPTEICARRERDIADRRRRPDRGRELTSGRMATYVVSTDSWRPLPAGQAPAYPG